MRFQNCLLAVYKHKLHIKKLKLKILNKSKYYVNLYSRMFCGRSNFFRHISIIYKVKLSLNCDIFKIDKKT